MQFCNDTKLDFKDVLIVPRYSNIVSRQEITTESEIIFNNNLSISGNMIFASNMYCTGTIEMAEALSKLNCFTCLHKSLFTSKLQLLPKNTFLTFGENHFHFQKEYLNNFPESFFKYICLDVANAYRQSFIDYVSEVRQILPNTIIMAGNVCTPDGVESLLDAGANIVKVGLGSGSQCRTRMVAGVGYPQLSAIEECSSAAAEKTGAIISDGGIREPGDISKSFVAGADAVMLGGILAGCTECSGKREGGKLMIFGESTKYAMDNLGRGLLSYRTSEGKISYVDCKGPVEEIIQKILGGVRSCCTYINARCVQDMSEQGKFILVNRIHE